RLRRQPRGGVGDELTRVGVGDRHRAFGPAVLGGDLDQLRLGHGRDRDRALDAAPRRPADLLGDPLGDVRAPQQLAVRARAGPRAVAPRSIRRRDGSPRGRRRATYDGAMARVLMAFEPQDGGVAENVLQLALALGAHGYEVEAAGPREAIVYDALQEGGIPI